MAKPAIKARGIGKRYRKDTYLRGKLVEWVRRGRDIEYFWALKNVTFEVKEGEMLGIVGPNGAGKSTLLRILSRITRPNEGYAEIRGRIGSLLAVGTGFHPELTGRENVSLNGALIGMRSAEIKRRFDDIVDFSGVGEFLDMPLKRYSTGMKLRLGFAVAVNLQQEIMLVDEVLSVGDAAFRERCLAKMEEVTHGGRTIIFVGHNMEMVSSSCDRVIWLDKGKIRAEGMAPEIVSAYQEEMTASKMSKDGFFSLEGRSDQDAAAPILFTHVRLHSGDGEPTGAFRTGAPAKIAVGYRIAGDLDPAELSVGVTILGRGQVSLAFLENRTVGDVFRDLPREGEFHCDVDRLPLMPGSYRLTLRCKVGAGLVQIIAGAAEFHVVEGEFFSTGLLPPAGSGSTLIEHRWSIGGKDAAP